MKFLPKPAKHKYSLKKSGKAFLRAKDGVAAIEFAIIAPVMIIMYMGLAEITMLVSADRNVSHTASVVADLVTQDNTIDRDEMEDIFNAAIAVMGVNSTKTANISMDVSSFEVDSDDNIVLVGHASMGSGFGSAYNANNVSATLLNQASGLVVTRIKYQYSSDSGLYDKTLEETFMLKPRKSKSVPFNGGPFVCTPGGSASQPNASC